jgi:hypothetical protein
MNKAAQALGKLAKGKPKTLTKAERKRRAESLAQARENRWPAKKADIPANVASDLSSTGGGGGKPQPERPTVED